MQGVGPRDNAGRGEAIVKRHSDVLRSDMQHLPIELPDQERTRVVRALRLGEAGEP